MNSFEIMGQARLDAVEGQRLMGIAVLRWVRDTAVKVLDSLGQHLPESKTAPW